MSKIIWRPLAAATPLRHSWRLGTGALALLALTTTAHAVGTDASRRTTHVDASKPVTPGEVVELRTATSTTVALPDGSFEATFSVAPVNRLNADGKYVPITTDVSKLDRVDAQGFGLAAEGNLLPARFATDRARVLAAGPMGDVVQAPMALRYTDGHRVDPISDALPSEAQAFGNQVTYADVFPGADLVYTVREGGLTKELLLRDRPRDPAAGLDPANTFLEFGERLELPAGATLSTVTGGPVKTGFETTGSLAIRASGGRPLIIGTPTAFESGEISGGSRSVFPVSQASFHTEIAPDGTVTLWTRVAYTWLGDRDRQLPIIPDPTLDVQPDETVAKDSLLWENISPDGNFGTLQVIVWGSATSGPSHGMLQFDLTTIPAGSTITTATLNLGPWAAAPGSTGPYSILENTGVWNETTVTWNNRPTVNATPVDTRTHTAGAHQDYTVTASVARMVAGTLTNNGWRVSPSPTGSAHTAGIASSSENPATERPHLIVVYTTGGSTGTGCDLTPVLAAIARTESKLDDGTRFTSDVELTNQTNTLNNTIINAQNTIINTLNPNIARVETKLDDGTRFTSDTERTNLQNAIVTEINQNEVKIDRVESKLDDERRFTDDAEFGIGLQAIAAIEAKADTDAANTAYQIAVQIEHALGEDTNVNKPMILYMLPAANGGHLEEVRALVDARINQVIASGCSAGSARSQWNAAVAQYALGHWDSAYSGFAGAYKTASMGPCN